MTRFDAFFFPHSVQIQDLTGSGGMGANWGPKRDVPAEVLDERSLVIGPDGREVVSNSRVTVPLEANVPIGSKVRIWPGDHAQRDAKVLQITRDQNPAPLPSHLVLYLT